MDQGPVDAGPSADVDYDHPTRSPSPGSLRDGLHVPPQQRSRFRSISSRRRSALHRGARSGLQEGFLSSNGSSRNASRSSRLRASTPSRPAIAGEDAGGVVAPGNEELKPRPESPDDAAAAAADEPPPAVDASRVYKYTLYETNARYWIVGADLSEQVYRLLRIDRTSPPGQIGLFEDGTTYSLGELNAVLTSIDEGNQATGGLRKRYQFWGVLGFIRFTEAFYMLVITKRAQVAMLGGHYVYQIEATELVPLTTGASGSRFVRDRNLEETRFIGIFNGLDLSKGFYFSYAYDVTNSLQHNIIRQRQAVGEGLHQAEPEFNPMFVWNHHLLKPALAALKHPFVWCLPIIHGFIDQASLDIFGRAVYITIIGRRSRFFAGARYLKRGVNDQGFVANDVETEQIVAEKLTTSFHAPGGRLYANPTYTSFLHHRGSIPLYWTQDNSGVSPKPDITLNLQDPFYQPAALHFDNLFERYGCPVYVLNLIKSRERTPRESKLLVEFQKCIDYLNQSMPADKKILYKAFDMSRASKTRGGDVIGSLEVIAKEIVAKTGFFRNGDEGSVQPQIQNGIARTNCIDCLDRTNAAQFVLGKRAFALQLQALGVIERDEVEYDTDATDIFTHMFHDHGDTIAVQYGGSHLVNTMATYRKLNHWQSSSRDMVESFKRYYHNSFLDNQRQEAYNLFLGNYVWSQGQPMLWDLVNDYYLHHSDPRARLELRRRDYIEWFTAEHLQLKALPPAAATRSSKPTKEKVDEYDDYWTETYRPTMLSSLGKVYAFRINSHTRFLPERAHRDAKYDHSPFKIRVDPHRHGIEHTPDRRSTPRKGVKILGPQDADSSQASSSRRESLNSQHQQPPSIMNEKTPSSSSIRRETPLPALTRTYTEPIKPSFGSITHALHPTTSAPAHQQQQQHTITIQSAPASVTAAADKARQNAQVLNLFHTQSLHPTVSEKEAHEYDRWIAHPLHLPLVVSTELPSDANIDYIEYVHRAGGRGAAATAAAFLAGEESGILAGAAGAAATSSSDVNEEDLHQFWEFLRQREDPLTVRQEDGAKKRYKAYRQWLRGKSLFKQSKVDPEFARGAGLSAGGRGAVGGL